MMPARPRPAFVLSHSQVTLAILEILLHAYPATTHQRQHLEPRLLRCVGHIVLHLSLTTHRTPHEQPDGWPRPLVAHRPYTYCRELEDHRFPRTFTQAQYLPRLGRQRLGYFLHVLHTVPDRLCWLRTPTGVLRDLRRRILRP